MVFDLNSRGSKRVNDNIDWEVEVTGDVRTGLRFVCVFPACVTNIYGFRLTY